MNRRKGGGSTGKGGKKKNIYKMRIEMKCKGNGADGGKGKERGREWEGREGKGKAKGEEAREAFCTL